MCGSVIASEILYGSGLCRRGGCPWGYHRHSRRSPGGARTVHHPDSGSSETLSGWVETLVDTNANMFKYSNPCVIGALCSPCWGSTQNASKYIHKMRPPYTVGFIKGPDHLKSPGKVNTIAPSSGTLLHS